MSWSKKSLSVYYAIIYPFILYIYIYIYGISFRVCMQYIFNSYTYAKKILSDWLLIKINTVVFPDHLLTQNAHTNTLFHDIYKLQVGKLFYESITILDML